MQSLQSREIADYDTLCDRVLMIQWIVCSLQILSLRVIYEEGERPSAFHHTTPYHAMKKETAHSAYKLNRQQEKENAHIRTSEYESFWRSIFSYLKRENECVSFEG